MCAEQAEGGALGCWAWGEAAGAWVHFGVGSFGVCGGSCAESGGQWGLRHHSREWGLGRWPPPAGTVY